MTDDSTQEMLNSFSTMQKQNEIAEVLKELFDENKIFMITDVSRDEAKLMTRIYMIDRIKNIPIWSEGLIFYCKILLSKNRKSRKELLEAMKGMTNQKSLLSRLNPFGDRGH